MTTADFKKYIEGGGFSLCIKNKLASKGQLWSQQWSQQDRWQFAALKHGAVCIVADGMSSSPQSGDFADLLCETFIDHCLDSESDIDNEGLFFDALEKALQRCDEINWEAETGAAFAAVYMNHSGDAWVAYLGDVFAWGFKGDEWVDLTGKAHTDKGKLTFYAGMPLEKSKEELERQKRQTPQSVEAVAVLSDGCHERERPESSPHRPSPHRFTHDLLRSAKGRATEDNSTAVLMKLSGASEERRPYQGSWSRMSVPVFLSSFALALLMGLFIGILIVEHDKSVRSLFSLKPVRHERNNPPPSNNVQDGPEQEPSVAQEPESRPKDIKSFLTGLQNRIVNDCKDPDEKNNLANTLQERGKRFGLAYVPQKLKKDLSKKDFNAPRFRSEFKEFLKDCDLSSSDCARSGQWWLIHHKDKGGKGKRGWVWLHELPCIDRPLEEGVLTGQKPVLKCEVKEVSQRVVCQPVEDLTAVEEKE